MLPILVKHFIDAKLHRIVPIGMRHSASFDFPLECVDFLHTAALSLQFDTCAATAITSAVSYQKST